MGPLGLAGGEEQPRGTEGVSRLLTQGRAARGPASQDGSKQGWGRGVQKAYLRSGRHPLFCLLPVVSRDGQDSRDPGAGLERHAKGSSWG